MKKTFTLIFMIVGMTISPILSAQNFTPVTTLFGSFNSINSKYTKSNNGYLVLSDHDYNQVSTDFKIYDEDLNEVKSITIKGFKGDDNYKEVYLRELEYNPDAPKEERMFHAVSSKESAISTIYQRFGKDNVSIIESNGQTLYYPTAGSSMYFFEYYIYGNKYPTTYYYIREEYENGHFTGFYELMEVMQSDCWVKTDRWLDPQIKDAGYYNHYDLYNPLYRYNCNNGIDYNSMIFTQTLFNDDSEFEYISPIYKFGQSQVDEREYEKFIYYDYNTIGFAICNSSGNELQRVLFPQELGPRNGDFTLLTIGDKEYLSLEFYTADNEYATILYTIGANGSGLQQVAEPIKVRVAPTVIRHDENINVELNDLKGEGRLTVTDIAGRTVFSTNVHENGIHQIPARTLSNGMNVVTVNTSAGKKSTKVIVK